MNERSASVLTGAGAFSDSRILIRYQAEAVGEKINHEDRR